MHGVGVDCIDVDAATDLKIQITNAAESNQSSVAEYTIGLILMLAKKSIRYNNGMKDGETSQVRTMYGMDVQGKTLGIIGMGNIGSQVAKMAAFGLHMNVIGYNRHITGTCQTEYGTLSGKSAGGHLLGRFLSLHPAGRQCNPPFHRCKGAFVYEAYRLSDQYRPRRSSSTKQL